MDNKNLQIPSHDFFIYRDLNTDVKVSVMLINNDMTYAKFNCRIVWCRKKYNNRTYLSIY